MLFSDPGAEAAREVGMKRDAGWPRAKREHLAKQPWCIACERQHRGAIAAVLRFFRGVDVHHIYPFHIVRVLDRPDLECDSRNLVTLCRGHHLVLGHFNDWNCYNPHVKHLALRFFGKPASVILADSEWNRFHGERKRDIRFLVGPEMAELRVKLDEKFPVRPPAF